MIVPLWLYACAGFNKTSGNLRFFTNSVTYSMSLSPNIFNGSTELSVNLTQWTNPGKFGLFNVYSGIEFIPCDSNRDPMYAWNKADWIIDGFHPSLIMQRPVYKSEICNKEKILFLTFPSTWEKTTKIATLLEGSVVNFQLRTKLQTWIKSIGVKGDSRYIWSGKMDGNICNFSWSNGYPKGDFNNTNICISCLTYCRQIACNFKRHSLIVIKEDRHFTLR